MQGLLPLDADSYRATWPCPNMIKFLVICSSFGIQLFHFRSRSAQLYVAECPTGRFDATLCRMGDNLGRVTLCHLIGRADSTDMTFQGRASAMIFAGWLVAPWNVGRTLREGSYKQAVLLSIRSEIYSSGWSAKAAFERILMLPWCSYSRATSDNKSATPQLRKYGLRSRL